MAKTLTSIKDVRGKNFQHLQLKFKIKIQIQDLKFPSISLNSIEFTIKTVCQLSCIDSITENLENIGTIWQMSGCLVSARRRPLFLKVKLSLPDCLCWVQRTRQEKGQTRFFLTWM